MTRPVAIAAMLVGSAVALTAQGRTFTTNTTVISANVAVKKGNAPIGHLTAVDFALTDSGVPQAISAASIETLPVDVTLFVDTSGSTAGRLTQMKRDVIGISGVLREGDRLRVLTIGDSVYEAVPWIPARRDPNVAGRALDLSFQPVGGVSLIYDAIAAALTHRPAPDRRHLVIAMTDRIDGGSIVSSALVLDMAARTDALLHLIEQADPGTGPMTYRPRGFTTESRATGPDTLKRAAERTGGEFHSGWRSSSALKAFAALYADFRQSYVLRYTREGVKPGGWHPIVVTLNNRSDVTIRSRQGYID
ncbi:MAG: VWA domain-containing protein [Acidobacteriota bacterium]